MGTLAVMPMRYFGGLHHTCRNRPEDDWEKPWRDRTKHPSPCRMRPTIGQPTLKDKPSSLLSQTKGFSCWVLGGEVVHRDSNLQGLKLAWN